MLSRLMWVVTFYVIFYLNSLGVQLSPLTFRFPLEKGRTQELNVINPSEESVRYKVRLEQPDNLKDPKLYMGEWIRYYPKILSVPPKSTRVVRFRATPPKDLVDGEYRAYLILEEMPKKEELPPKVEIKDEEEDSSGEIESILKTRFIFYLGLYGEKGELEPKVEFQNLTLTKASEEKLQLNGKILNLGNVSVKSIALITFKDPNNKKNVEKREVVLPITHRENSEEFNLPFNKPSGNFSMAEVEIRHWTPEAIGDLIELRKIRF